MELPINLSDNNYHQIYVGAEINGSFQFLGALTHGNLEGFEILEAARSLIRRLQTKSNRAGIQVALNTARAVPATDWTTCTPAQLYDRFPSIAAILHACCEKIPGVTDNNIDVIVDLNHNHTGATLLDVTNIETENVSYAFFFPLANGTGWDMIPLTAAAFLSAQFHFRSFNSFDTIMFDEKEFLESDEVAAFERNPYIKGKRFMSIMENHRSENFGVDEVYGGYRIVDKRMAEAIEIIHERSAAFRRLQGDEGMATRPPSSEMSDKVRDLVI